MSTFKSLSWNGFKVSSATAERSSKGDVLGKVGARPETDAYNNDSAATTEMSRTETPKTKRTMKLPRVKCYPTHSRMEAFPVHPIHLQAANTIPMSCHPLPLSYAQLTPHGAVLDQDSTNTSP